MNLRLHRGETVVIFGCSGCGKSTLLQSIAGSVIPDEGEIEVLGRCLFSLRGRELDQHRIRVGMLYQSGALFHSMTVGENIACVLREHTRLKEEEIQIVTLIKLEMVGLREAEDLLPSELSGGMRKRASLARALALDPSLMLYDEPGAGLDPVTLAGVDRLIGTLGRALNIGSLVVTHRVQSALAIAHRVLFLHEGQVLVEGTPEEIREHADPHLRQFLAGSAEGPLTDRGIDESYATALLGMEARP
ncbi:MAG: ABC transporter ATP-binding protein [Planctomycetota bacterium]